MSLTMTNRHFPVVVPVLPDKEEEVEAPLSPVAAEEGLPAGHPPLGEEPER